MSAAESVESVSPARHVPERTCVACRRKRPQPEFVRVTREGGTWALRAGVRSGRGAYICADSPACWHDKRLRRAFGAQAAGIAAHLLQTHQEHVSIPIAAPPSRPARPSPEVSDVESPNL